MFEGLEKRVSKYGNITYWKEGVLIGRKCTVCGEDKEIGEFNFKNKKEGVYRPNCKECEKRYREANKEHIKEKRKQYWENNKETLKEKNKQWCEENREYRKEYYREYGKINKERKKQYREVNKEHIREQTKQYREANKEHIKEKSKQHYEANKEHILKRGKQRYEVNKNNNIAKITRMLYQLNPIFKQLNIKAYGSIYKITNVKTGRCYIGQTIQPLKRRYTTNMIKGWIEERLEKDNQRFIDELVEENFVIETLDYGVCKYHLDKLEVYYIDKYNSIVDGYNNREGYHKTNDGIEEFNKILEDNGLKFVDGKIITI